MSGDPGHLVSPLSVTLNCRQAKRRVKWSLFGQRSTRPRAPPNAEVVVRANVEPILLEGGAVLGVQSHGVMRRI
jgi:hypothetical protein